jgi:protein phosphatase
VLPGAHSHTASNSQADFEIMRFNVGAATDTGRIRNQNEDAFAARPERGLFVVCDGMGGSAAGEVASRIAIDTIVDELNGAALPQLPDDAGFLPRTRRLAAAVRQSNQNIYDQAQRDASQAEMGTTVVAAWLDQHIASLAHVGDSRAYLWRQARLEPLTRDHSLVEAQVQAGLIDRQASAQSEQQNVLTRVLGREREVEVDVEEVPVVCGDYLLLCSDGLTRTVTDAAMAETISELREPRRICTTLIDAANRNGGPDNITVVVVEVAGNWFRSLAASWLRW